MFRPERKEERRLRGKAHPLIIAGAFGMRVDPCCCESARFCYFLVIIPQVLGFRYYILNLF
jgi:hypothetical protein